MRLEQMTVGSIPLSLSPRAHLCRNAEQSSKDGAATGCHALARMRVRLSNSNLLGQMLSVLAQERRTYALP